MGTALTWTQFLIALSPAFGTWPVFNKGREGGRRKEGKKKKRKKGENNRKKREIQEKNGPKICLLKLDDYSN